jgi:hypothetical protein
VPTKATLVAQADPDDPQEMLARVWLAAYAEGSINDKTATYPDTARRVFAVADAPDAPEATLAAHHLCGLTTPAYVRSLRRQQRSARKGSRRHTVSDLSRSKNSDAGHSDTTTADDADQLPSSGSSSEHRKKRRDSAAAAATAATAAASGSSTSTTGAAAAAAASAAGDRKPRRDRAKNVLPSTPSEL